MVTDKQTEKSLKEKLIYWLVWRLHYPIVVDEWQYMDIFGVQKSGYCTEFEIKVSKQDFARELRMIKATEQPVKYKDREKWKKHQAYINGKRTWGLNQVEQILHQNGIDTPIFRPNKYYFYVPDYLVEYVLERVKGLPYGVVSIGYTQNSYGREYYYDYTIVKPAQFLHKDKVNSILIEKLAHALTMRNRLLQ